MMAAPTSYGSDGYQGVELFHLEYWLIELNADRKLESFHQEVAELLDIFEEEDPHPFQWHLSSKWGDFVDACFDLSERVDSFLRANSRAGEAKNSGFPQITEKLPFWDDPNQYL